MLKDILQRLFLSKASFISRRCSSWGEARDRLIPEVWPECAPSFRIGKHEEIFTVGSCFARNMEEYLARAGYKIPMAAFSVPKEEWPHRPNGILNKYSPTDIFDELTWCEQVRMKGGKVAFEDIEKLLFVCDDGRLIDMHIGGYRPVTKERALRRRQDIYDVFSHAFSSQVVVMTLGLIEVWYDSKNELFIQRTPAEDMKKDKGRFKFTCLNYSECYDYIDRSILLIRKYSPKCKILLTTSPVPLRKTFTDDDVIVANMYSKSVLRAVCGELVTKHSLVDYFPSYESVILTRNWSVYDEDLRHVSDSFVKKIVERLAALYC